MRVLTGIKPTGELHLGNYIGAIKQIIELSKENEVFLFIADYHALNNGILPEELQNNTRHILAALNSFFSDNNQVKIYLQSQIPEIFELAIILTNCTAKGLLNRAHAYKSIVDQNISSKKDIDFNVNIGLYNYPLLMASDILLFNTQVVPVGVDQKQHIEIARDIASTFNNRYEDIFILPKALIVENKPVIGLDGRKMSKSYHNTIPLFSTDEIIWNKFKKIKSSSTQLGEKIDTKDDILFNIMDTFAEKELMIQLTAMYDTGVSRLEIKQLCYNYYLNYFGTIREKYNILINDENLMNLNKEQCLEVKQYASKNLKIIKKTIGLIN